MADNTQEDKIKLLTDAMLRVGVTIDPATPQQIKKSLDPVAQYFQKFNANTDIKNTFWGKLPTIKTMLKNLEPDNSRFIRHMIGMGLASKNNADGMEFYSKTLGFTGRRIVDITNLVGNMGRVGAAAASAMTLGLAAIVAIAVNVAQTIWNVIQTGIQWQDQLNDFSKVMGVLTKDRLMVFNENLMNMVGSIRGAGFAFGEVMNTVKGYIANGIAPAIAMQRNLVETTLQLSEVTGEASAEIASFFGNLMRGSKLGADNLRALGGSLGEFNRSAERSGLLGSVSFSDVKEAVSSVGTALLIASNKGSTFANKLSNDLVSLTGLAKNLGISVSEMNSKFEEAGNLISSQSSPFRALLAISGGAGIQNMLSNQFNRTDAMLKVADTLKRLNEQFHGNLNIMGQVAQEAFGISKDVAIKLATMSIEQKKALMQAKEDSDRMQSSGLSKSFEAIVSTVTSSIERFKNILKTAFMEIFATNPGLQRFLSHVGEMMTNFSNTFKDESSPFGKVVVQIKEFVTRFFDGLDKFLGAIGPGLDNLVAMVDNILSAFAKADGFWSGIWGMVKELAKSLWHTLKDILWPIFLAGAEAIGISITHAVRMALPKRFLGGYSDFDKQSGNAANEYTFKMAQILPKLNEKLSVGLTETKENTNAQIKSTEAMLKNYNLSINKQNQDRLGSLKDTDVVVGKDGQLTLAGLERYKLQDEAKKIEMEIAEAQRKAQEANTEELKRNTAAMKAEKQKQEEQQAPAAHASPAPSAPKPVVGGLAGNPQPGMYYSDKRGAYVPIGQ